MFSKKEAGAAMVVTAPAFMMLPPKLNKRGWGKMAVCDKLLLSIEYSKSRLKKPRKVYRYKNSVKIQY